MNIETVELPSEIAFLPVNEKEEILSNDTISGEDKLIYVCRGQDD